MSITKISTPQIDPRRPAGTAGREDNALMREIGKLGKLHQQPLKS
jgi:hypothetical protein